MTYRTTRENLIKKLKKKKQLTNQMLSSLVKDEFFIPGGPDGIGQLKRDVFGQYLIAGQSRFGNQEKGYEGVKALSNDAIKSRLKELLGIDDARCAELLAAHSQVPSYLLLNTAATCGTYDYMIQMSIDSEQVINIFRDENANIIYQCQSRRYPVVDSSVLTGEYIGFMDGPFETTFKLTQKNNVWGYELVDAKIGNESIRQIMLDEWPYPTRSTKDNNCDAVIKSVVQTAQQVLLKDCDLISSELNKIVRNTKDEKLKLDAEQKLKEIAKQREEFASRNDLSVCVTYQKISAGLRDQYFDFIDYALVQNKYEKARDFLKKNAANKDVDKRRLARKKLIVLDKLKNDILDNPKFDNEVKYQKFDLHFSPNGFMDLEPATAYVEKKYQEVSKDFSENAKSLSTDFGALSSLLKRLSVSGDSHAKKEAKNGFDKTEKMMASVRGEGFSVGDGELSNYKDQFQLMYRDKILKWAKNDYEKTRAVFSRILEDKNVDVQARLIARKKMVVLDELKSRTLDQNKLSPDQKCEQFYAFYLRNKLANKSEMTPEIERYYLSCVGKISIAQEGVDSAFNAFALAMWIPTGDVNKNIQLNIEKRSDVDMATKYERFNTFVRLASSALQLKEDAPKWSDVNGALFRLYENDKEALQEKIGPVLHKLALELLVGVDNPGVNQMMAALATYFGIDLTIVSEAGKSSEYKNAHGALPVEMRLKEAHQNDWEAVFRQSGPEYFDEQAALRRSRQYQHQAKHQKSAKSSGYKFIATKNQLIAALTEKSLLKATPYSLNNPYLREAMAVEFFNQGENGWKQAKIDILERDVLCEGMANLGWYDATSWVNVKPEEIKLAMAQILGFDPASPEFNKSIEAFSQQATYLVYNVLTQANSHGDPTMVARSLAPPLGKNSGDRKITLFKNNAGVVCVKAEYMRFPLLKEGELYGFLEGPVEMMFEFREQVQGGVKRGGYELVDIKTNNPLIHKALFDHFFTDAEIETIDEKNIVSVKQAVLNKHDVILFSLMRLSTSTFLNENEKKQVAKHIIELQQAKAGFAAQPVLDTDQYLECAAMLKLKHEGFLSRMISYEQYNRAEAYLLSAVANRRFSSDERRLAEIKLTVLNNLRIASLDDASLSQKQQSETFNVFFKKGSFENLAPMTAYVAEKFEAIKDSVLLSEFPDTKENDDDMSLQEPEKSDSEYEFYEDDSPSSSSESENDDGDDEEETIEITESAESLDSGGEEAPPVGENAPAVNNYILGDGNCAFNAFIMALAKPSILRPIEAELKRETEDPNVVFADFITAAAKKWKVEANWQAVRAKMLSLRDDNPVQLQKDAAPIIRSLSIQLARKNLADGIERTINPLQAAFNDFVHAQRRHSRNAVARIEGDDIFRRHDFIQKKFAEIYANVRENKADALEQWWQQDNNGQPSGYSQFLTAMEKPSAWAGDLELARLAEYFNVNLVVSIKDQTTFPHDVTIDYGSVPVKDVSSAYEELAVRKVIEPTNEATSRILLDQDDRRLRLGQVPSYSQAKKAIETDDIKLLNELLPDCINELKSREVITSVGADEDKTWAFKMADKTLALARINSVPNLPDVEDVLDKHAKSLPVIRLQNQHHNHWVLDESPEVKKKKLAGAKPELDRYEAEVDRTKQRMVRWKNPHHDSDAAKWAKLIDKQGDVEPEDRPSTYREGNETYHYPQKDLVTQSGKTAKVDRDTQEALDEALAKKMEDREKRKLRK